MGRGRAPCCDKSKVKKGPWSPAEDLRLISFIQKHGHGNWRALPKQAGLLRCGKSCRLRWINYLRPDVKRGNFTKEEEETIIKLHQSFGNRWSKIASSLPGRTDNEIKNVWNTHLKKRLINYDLKDHETEFSPAPPSSSNPNSFMSSFKNYQDIRDQELQNEDCFTKTNTHEVCDIIEVLEEEQNSLIGTLTVSPVIKGQFSTQDFNLHTSIPITDEPKEVSSSSSISSYASNYSNSNTRVDVSMPQEEGESLFNCVLGPCEVDNTAYGLLNNQSSVALDRQLMIEIDPLEPDVAFWDTLDNLDPLQSSESQPQDQYLDLASQSSNNFGEECEQREIECWRWLRYLENELGLVEATRDGGQYQDYINPTKDAAGDDHMMLMPETDIQNFGI